MELHQLTKIGGMLSIEKHTTKFSCRDESTKQDIMCRTQAHVNVYITDHH